MSDHEIDRTTPASPRPDASKAHGDALLDQSGSRHGTAPPESTATDEDGATDEDAPKRRRARGGRSRGRRRNGSRGTFEATFDHGEEGYGLWLDPEVADDPTYAEHWAGHRPVEVTIEEDQIVIRRAGGASGDDD